MDAFAQKIKDAFENGLSRPLDDECVDPLYTDVTCTLTVSDCRAIMLALTPDLPRISESTVPHVLIPGEELATTIEDEECCGILYVDDEGDVVCNECGKEFEVKAK